MLIVPKNLQDIVVGCLQKPQDIVVCETGGQKKSREGEKMGVFDDLKGTAGKSTARVIDGGKRKAPAKGGKRKPPVERVRGEVIGGGSFSGGLPVSVDEVGERVGGWLVEWCAVHGVSDMRRENQHIFMAFCIDLGKQIVKPSHILKDTAPHGVNQYGAPSTCNAWNPSAVAALFDVFRRVCAEYGKIPFQTAFAAFSGCSLSYVREYGEYLTSRGLDISERTHAAEVDAIRQGIAGQTVGGIAILNNEYWGGGGSQTSEGIPAAVGLPVFGRD